jgi:hypothetical protein
MEFPYVTPFQVSHFPHLWFSAFYIVFRVNYFRNGNTFHAIF